MAHTNSTENYGLPQWIGTDKPTFLGDFNSAFAAIDTAMKANSDTATAASATANAAEAVASSAAANATNAIGIANNAASEAETATSAAASATQTANTAKTNADNALRASAANSIENLAPAYDNTLTYNVGDLVTYIDAQNSGKLYKCIVAVNTPMDFNINYWDDVTTSEAFKAKNRVIATVTADGVMTLSDILSALFSAYSNPLNVPCMLKHITGGGSVILDFVSNAVVISNAEIDFSRIVATGSGLQGETYILKSTPEAWLVRCYTGNTTVTDKLSDIPSSGDVYTIETV